MSKATAKKMNEELDRQKKEIEEALNEQIEETMREAALPNAIAFVVVVVGSFLINIVILIAISGG